MSNCPCLCNDCSSGVHDESWQVCCAYAREIERLSVKLAMAEGLLRRAHPITRHGPYLYLNRLNIRPDEIEYLRSLDGEGDSDE